MLGRLPEPPLSGQQFHQTLLQAQRAHGILHVLTSCGQLPWSKNFSVACLQHQCFCQRREGHERGVVGEPLRRQRFDVISVKNGNRMFETRSLCCCSCLCRTQGVICTVFSTSSIWILRTTSSRAAQTIP